MTRTEDLPLELLTEQVMGAFAPLPKEQTEKARVQQLVTSWSLGKTEQEQVANIAALSAPRGFNSASRKAPTAGEPCASGSTSIAVLPPRPERREELDQGTPDRGCHCRLLSPEMSRQGLAPSLGGHRPGVGGPSRRRIRRLPPAGAGVLQSRLPLVIWQGSPHGYQDGAYRQESEASVKAELNLHVKREFNALGFEETPNVTTKVVHNAYQAASALVFDRAESSPLAEAERTPRRERIPAVQQRTPARPHLPGRQGQLLG